MKSKAKPYQRFLVATLLLIGVAAFISLFMWTFYWETHGSKAPLPETGQIYRHHNGGHIFYVTRAQSSLKSWLVGVSFVCIFGVLVLNREWNALPNPDNDLPKKLY
jgi:hypothetical protein